MLHNNHVFTKNGYNTNYHTSGYVNWTLSFNMATNIKIVSDDGKVYQASFSDKLTTLFDYAMQMSITTDALVFYVPLFAVTIQEFMSNHGISYTEVSFLDIGHIIVLDDTIRCVLTDTVNIDMFHMMSNYMMMDIDAKNEDTMPIEIDDDWYKFIDDLMDVDFSVPCQ